MKLMLSATIRKLEDIEFPVVGSVKFDGVRAIVLERGKKYVVFSRNMKPIPNHHVQKMFGIKELMGFDGELLVGQPNAPDVYRQTMSSVMSKDGKPKDLQFACFDIYRKSFLGSRYVDRLYTMSNLIHQSLALRGVVSVVHLPLRNIKEVEVFEEQALAQGYEGVMLRNPNRSYKNGRSTMKEQGMMKLKRFSDSEAEVIGWEEQMHNANEGFRNPLTGKLERSSHLANMQGTGVLGALIVRDLESKVEFNIGTGFSADERRTMFIYPPSLMGKIAKYRFFPSGSKEKPRFPVFAGWRDPRDL